MKSLKNEFVKNSILIVVISAVSIITMTLLLFFAYYSKRKNVLDALIKNVVEMFRGIENEGNWFLSYTLIWLLLSTLIIIVVIGIFSRTLKNSIIEPLEDLKLSANEIAEGRLDIEVMSSRYMEIDKLSKSFDEIRRKLEKNRIVEKKIIEERNLLLANLSHDLRTPITSIKGYLEGIRDGVADTEEKKEKYLSTIYRKTLLLQSIVENMSELSELEIGRMRYAYEVVEMKAYMEHLCEIYKLEAEERGLQLESRITEEEIYISADRNKLKRAFDNLVSNALKYTKKGGTIKIVMSKEKEGAFIRILDSGKGIKEKDLQHIFDSFFRGDAARTNIDGTGLGLGIAKQIIEAHRGKLWIASQEEKGTEVFVYFHQR